MLKKSLLVAALGIVAINSVQAQCNPCPCSCQRGFYGLANVGWASVNYNNNSFGQVAPAGPITAFVASSSSPSQQWGLGVGLGYQWNDYFALDGAFDYFFSQQKTNFTYNFNGVAASGSVTQKNTYALLLLAKGIIPLQQGFSLYGRLGGAYEWTQVNASASNFANSTSGNGNSLRPAYGLGVDYQICPNLTTYLDWTGIAGNKSSASVTTTATTATLNTSVKAPTVNYINVGLRYFFE